MISNPINSAYYLATVEDVEQNVNHPLIQDRKSVV